MFQLTTGRMDRKCWPPTPQTTSTSLIPRQHSHTDYNNIKLAYFLREAGIKVYFWIFQSFCEKKLNFWFFVNLQDFKTNVVKTKHSDYYNSSQLVWSDCVQESREGKGKKLKVGRPAKKKLSARLGISKKKRINLKHVTHLLSIFLRNMFGMQIALFTIQLIVLRRVFEEVGFKS